MTYIDSTTKAFARIFFGIELDTDNGISVSDADPIEQTYT